MSESLGEVENNPLNDTWILYAHLPHDTDWSINSYKKILKISTAEQIISVCESLPEPMVQNCMLFLMRENIKPIWEDKNNNKGGAIIGCPSLKYPLTIKRGAIQYNVNPTQVYKPYNIETFLSQLLSG